MARDGAAGGFERLIWTLNNLTQALASLLVVLQPPTAAAPLDEEEEALGRVGRKLEEFESKQKGDMAFCFDSNSSSFLPTLPRASSSSSTGAAAVGGCSTTRIVGFTSARRAEEYLTPVFFALVVSFVSALSFSAVRVWGTRTDFRLVLTANQRLKEEFEKFLEQENVRRAPRKNRG
ncbi:unnamed protein product [Cuscuta campestris]|uniref:Transmembrane protein n=1 Tax=Cuscuta campestris TaxID=132261 RepID=A0A484N5D9_9ASTE|nr:unnamed protein product [Cuscuta campestris]